MGAGKGSDHMERYGEIRRDMERYGEKGDFGHHGSLCRSYSKPPVSFFVPGSEFT